MTPIPRNKIVVAHSVRPDAPQHEIHTNKALARWLAQILGLKFGGSYDAQKHRGRDLYLLPTQTIVGAAKAHELGIKGPEDLWGGFVEHDFICTKAISHGLRSHLARAPQGWSPLFSERTRNVVLDGLSVFDLKDARPRQRRWRDSSSRSCKMPRPWRPSCRLKRAQRQYEKANRLIRKGFGVAVVWPDLCTL